MADELFESLNNHSHTLEYLVGDSAEELKKAIKSIHLPLNIISIYAVGNKHYAWINTSAKIVKKVKKDK